jgi:predicted dinucleotide-binding enzyme
MSLMARRVGIIGSGVVGQTLANGFIRHGYEVMIGTHNRTKHDELRQKTHGRAQIGTFPETARFGDLIVLAVKGTAAEGVLGQIGLQHLDGKIVIDTTNPIAETPPVNGVLQYFTGPNESLMERLQQAAPAARFVKAFSCVGNALMVNPMLASGKPTMFICGNDADAKVDVGRILDQFGFEVEDCGGVEGARAIEPLCILWCIPGFLTGRWMHAFKLLKA